MDRKDLLLEAAGRVYGTKDIIYGPPEDNFGKIAELWSDYKGVNFSEEDVALMMILLKIARVSGDCPTLDSFVDIAGYAACGGEIVSAHQKRNDQAEETEGKIPF